ncbi:VOC family protein [Blautia sp. MSJ-19]|uniref:VOC family protein n=1 Tax=Blautia sp. MSJ-19 TaxID=2841517 RepID=UPI001C0E9AA9|nr:VOC family protein [Blautia sp. MSJ-19]MBU5480323.1 VOC family protein [Blautia sp. MSJ-19]
MKINNLHYVAYAVNEYDKVREFWKKLGFSILGNNRETIFWIGKAQIQLHSTANTALAAEWRKRHTRDDLYELCLEVENLEDTIRELQESGIKIEGEIQESVQGRSVRINSQHTGEYYLRFIELKDSLKHHSVQEQQNTLAGEFGQKEITAEMLSVNKVGMTNIHHIGISIRDYERARHLWQDVLGFEALYQHFKERDFKEDAMYLGDAQIHLYRSENPELKFCWWPQKNGDGMETLSVCVDKINQTIRQIRECGMDIVGDGPESMSQGMDVFIDKKYTGGNDFEIVELHYFLKGKTVEQQKKIVYHFFGEGTVL